MHRLALASLVLSLVACSSGRTASCQQLFDCCHGSADCDPVVDQNDPGACQSQLIVSRGSGMCAGSDGGVTDAAAAHLACTTGASGGMLCVETSGPSTPATCPSGASPVAACPTSGEVGRCAITASDGSVTVLHFYPPTDAPTAMSSCTMSNGTFTPG